MNIFYYSKYDELYWNNENPLPYSGLNIQKLYWEDIRARKPHIFIINTQNQDIILYRLYLRYLNRNLKYQDIKCKNIEDFKRKIKLLGFI